MGTKEKLIARFVAKPTDFTYQELNRLLGFWGYIELQAEGSRVVFRNKETRQTIKLHKPHPGNIMKRYQLELVENELKEKGLL
jgi:hypothetical protein